MFLLLSTAGALRSLTCVTFLSLGPFWMSANRAFLPPSPPSPSWSFGGGHCHTVGEMLLYHFEQCFELYYRCLLLRVHFKISSISADNILSWYLNNILLHLIKKIKKKTFGAFPFYTIVNLGGFRAQTKRKLDDPGLWSLNMKGTFYFSSNFKILIRNSTGILYKIFSSTYFSTSDKQISILKRMRHILLVSPLWLKRLSYFAVGPYLLAVVTHLTWGHWAPVVET